MLIRDTRPRFVFVGGGLLFALAAVGCVQSQFEQTKQARADYRECLEAHPRDPERCESLRQAASREWDQYEENARQECHEHDICGETWNP